MLPAFACAITTGNPGTRRKAPATASTGIPVPPPDAPACSSASSPSPAPVASSPASRSTPATKAVKAEAATKETARLESATAKAATRAASLGWALTLSLHDVAASIADHIAGRRTLTGVPRGSEARYIQDVILNSGTEGDTRTARNAGQGR